MLKEMLPKRGLCEPTFAERSAAQAGTHRPRLNIFQNLRGLVAEVLKRNGPKSGPKKDRMKLSEAIKAMEEVIEPKMRATHGDAAVDAALRAAGYDAGNSATPRHSDSIRKKVEAFKTLTDGGVAQRPKLAVLPPAAASTSPTPQPQRINPMTSTTTPKSPETKLSLAALEAGAKMIFGSEVDFSLAEFHVFTGPRHDRKQVPITQQYDRLRAMFCRENFTVPGLDFTGLAISGRPNITSPKARATAQKMLDDFFAELNGASNSFSAGALEGRKLIQAQQAGSKVRVGDKFDHARADEATAEEHAKPAPPKWIVGEGGPRCAVWEAEQKAKALRAQFS